MENEARWNRFTVDDDGYRLYEFPLQKSRFRAPPSPLYDWNAAPEARIPLMHEPEYVSRGLSVVVNDDGNVRTPDGQLHFGPYKFADVDVVRNGVAMYDCLAYDPFYGCDAKVTQLFANPNDSGAVVGRCGAPEDVGGSWEWRHRVCVDASLIRSSEGASSRQRFGSLMYRVAVRRTRFGPSLRNPYGVYRRYNPSCLGLCTWFVRTVGEIDYCWRIRELIDERRGDTDIPYGWRVDGRLLVLGPRYGRDFRFLRYHRGDQVVTESGKEYTAYAKHLNENRHARQQMNLTGYLLDYHNKEFELFTEHGRIGRYAAMPPGWSDLCTTAHGFIYAEMPPVLTYCADRLICWSLGQHLTWQILLTERVAIVASAWHRQVYCSHRLWWTPDWMSYQMDSVLEDEHLVKVMGSERNVQDFRALRKRFLELFDEHYDSDWARVPRENRVRGERSDYPAGFDSGRSGPGGDFLYFVAWMDKLVTNTAEWRHYQRNLPLRPVGHPCGSEWASAHLDPCYLSVLNGERPFTFPEYDEAPVEPKKPGAPRLSMSEEENGIEVTAAEVGPVHGDEEPVVPVVAPWKSGVLPPQPMDGRTAATQPAPRGSHENRGLPPNSPEGDITPSERPDTNLPAPSAVPPASKARSKAQNEQSKARAVNRVARRRKRRNLVRPESETSSDEVVEVSATPTAKTARPVTRSLAGKKETAPADMRRTRRSVRFAPQLEVELGATKDAPAVADKAAGKKSGEVAAPKRAAGEPAEGAAKRSQPRPRTRAGLGGSQPASGKATKTAPNKSEPGSAAEQTPPTPSPPPAPRESSPPPAPAPPVGLIVGAGGTRAALSAALQYGIIIRDNSVDIAPLIRDGSIATPFLGVPVPGDNVRGAIRLSARRGGERHCIIHFVNPTAFDEARPFRGE